MNRIQIDAPCKVNLSLDIVGKLPNGYHETDMVMQTVSLCDTISLQLQPGSGQIQMSCRFEPDNGNSLLELSPAERTTSPSAVPAPSSGRAAVRFRGTTFPSSLSSASR